MSEQSLRILTLVDAAGDTQTLHESLQACGHQLTATLFIDPEVLLHLATDLPDLVVIQVSNGNRHKIHPIATAVREEYQLPLLFYGPAQASSDWMSPLERLYFPYPKPELRLQIAAALERSAMARRLRQYRALIDDQPAFGDYLHEPETQEEPASQSHNPDLRSLNRLGIQSFTLKHLALSLFLHDDYGVIMFANGHACRSLGYSSQQLQGMNISVLDSQLSPNTVASHTRQLRKVGTLERLSMFERADGSRFPVEIRSSYVVYQDTPCALLHVQDISHRENLKTRLWEEQTRTRQFLDIAGVMLVALDEHGRVTLANRRACELLGYRESELLGKEWFDTVLPIDQRNRVRELHQQLMNGVLEPLSHAQHPVVTRDQQIRIIAWNHSLLHNSRGHIAGILSSGEDVTERQQTLRALEISEQRWKFALEGSAQGVWDWQIKDGGLFLSDRWKEMLHCDNDNPPRHFDELMELVHPDDRHALQKAIDGCIEGAASTFAVEHRMRTPTNPGHWYLARGMVAERDDYDRPLRMIGTHSDIDSRKRSEAELLASNRALMEEQELFSGGPTMVFRWIREPGWPAGYCSRNVYTVLGYNPRDLTSGVIPYDKLIHPEDSDRIEREIEQHLTSGRSYFEQSYRLRHARGNYLDCHDYTRVVRNRNGEVTSLHGYVMDVTRQRADQAERTRMERELQQARKMEALGQLTGGIAHEFNNMLAIILGYLGLMKMRLDDQSNPDLARFLGHIEVAGERAKDLVRQMMVFGRKQERNPHPISLKPLVQQIIALAQATMPASIEIRLDPQSGLPDVNMDPGEVQQMVMNLFLNARDAMEGEGTMHVELTTMGTAGQECSACHKAIDGDWVVIAVTDSGPGIPLQEKARIFDPFFTTKEVGKGTGLGLAVVQSIMERNGGHILLDSEPGKGACFRLLFRGLPTPGNSLPAPSARGASPPCRLSGNALVVDDEPALSAFKAEVLGDCGLQVTQAESGLDALKKLQAAEQTFHLLLTDQTMPGLLGTDLARQAKEFNPDLRVILCTGHSERINEENAGDFAVDRFLVKPVDPDFLKTVLKDLLLATANGGSAATGQTEHQDGP